MSNTAKTASDWIKNADAILVTASNGLSISEGLNLFANDKKLKEVLGNLVDKYHLPNILQALSFPYKSKLDHWRAIARIVEYYGNNYEPSTYMNDIKKLIDDKPYYVWTSNIDHHFSLSDYKNVFEMEGNWFEGICSEQPEKHGKYYLGEKLHQIYMKDQDGTLTEDDIPVCDVCGSELDLNLPQEGFQVDEEKLIGLQRFIEKYMDQNLVVLELGIGPRNRMIKAPSMNIVASGQRSHYITINQGQLMIPDQITDRSIGFDSSISLAFKELLTGEDMGDPVIVHCFTQEGQYYKVRLGLNKEKDEVHSFYVDAGTFIAIELAPESTGFSVINTEIGNSNAQTLVPKIDTLLRLFPDQRDIINKFSTFK